MDTLLAFGDSVLKGVIYENEHYEVIDTAFYRKCAETLGIVIENNYSEYLCDDGIHPNERGHELIAEAILYRLSRKNATNDLLRQNPLVLYTDNGGERNDLFRKTAYTQKE